EVDIPRYHTTLSNFIRAIVRSPRGTYFKPGSPTQKRAHLNGIIETAGLTQSLTEFSIPVRPLASRIAIKEKNRIRFIDPAEILAVKAEGNYVLLQLVSKTHMLRESISGMEERLRSYGFVRIHRSFVVNAAFVEEIRPL